MKRSTFLSLLFVSLVGTFVCGAKEDLAYGENPAAGKTASINGIDLYYEIYGEGEPLLLLHPNSGSIAAMAPQIEEFSKKYRVIAPDNRGHGRSGTGGGQLTYPLMADDFDKLLDQLGVKSAHVVGWSDGGILGLLLAIHHPDKVGKLAIMGANLNPQGAHDWALEWVAREVEEANKHLANGDEDPGLKIHLQRMELLGKQPQIPVSELKKIDAPALVMAADRDVIRNEHTLLIFDNIPRSQLDIFPGATHMIPAEQPVRFNQSVLRFLGSPFSRPDTKNMMR